MVPRLYLTVDLIAGHDASGSDSHAHYLRSVLRKSPGDQLTLFNGRDGEFTATIATLAKSAATFTVTAQLRPQTPEPDLTLAFCLLKRDATDLVIQKATELGARDIRPLTSDRTNTPRINLDRLKTIAIEAAEQSERLTIPTVHPPQDLHTLLATWPKTRHLAAALERAAAPPPTSQTALLVGPEGGFSPRELDALHAAPFIQPVSFGPRILRAETAAIAGLATLLLARPQA
jgi:16S rRNA (uracil1498-N3)-methyltransferase